MSDALLSPTVGGAMWAATAGTMAYCSKKVGKEMDDIKVPLMGVLGAFVFAAQMINFTIPGTGSSGHIGGGLLLAVLLGPHAAFLTLASVLTVQALFFADGGLLALGSNIFNLGAFPCFIAYPLVYRAINKSGTTKSRLVLSTTVAAILGLQLGSLGVVLQTTLSGIAELPFASFLLIMQPIHLAIGLVEGLVTAAVLLFIRQARPDLVGEADGKTTAAWSVNRILLGLAVSFLLIGGIVSWFASSRPDGLEWSIAKTTGNREIAEREHDMHRSLAELQEKTALMPDYALQEDSAPETVAENGRRFSMDPRLQTTAAGLIGGFLTLLTVLILGMVIKKSRTRHDGKPSL